jgi:hypothetical protein
VRRAGRGGAEPASGVGVSALVLLLCMSFEGM